jgi:hypothetical protein
VRLGQPRLPRRLTIRYRPLRPPQKSQKQQRQQQQQQQQQQRLRFW